MVKKTSLLTLWVECGKEAQIQSTSVLPDLQYSLVVCTGEHTWVLQLPQVGFWRPGEALQPQGEVVAKPSSSTDFLLLLPFIVPLYEGVLIHHSQLEGRVLLHNAVFQHKLPNFFIVLNDQGPLRHGCFTLSLRAGVYDAQPNENGLHQHAAVRPLCRRTTLPKDTTELCSPHQECGWASLLFGTSFIDLIYIYVLAYNIMKSE